MKNFYITIDNSFLETITSESQQKIKKIISHDQMAPSADRKCFVRLCPYCKKFGVLSCRIFEADELGNTEPSVCVYCGESTPYIKIRSSIKKAQILFDLSNQFASNDSNQRNTRNERVLLEQCVVVLATGIDLYLKDIYVLSMNLKYVKPEHTLHLKFSQDSKNDFLNIGKTVKKFKDDFGINIIEILGQETTKNLKYLMLIRNLIVHNDGNVDLVFLNNIPDNLKVKYRIAAPIPISNIEIAEFINSTQLVLDKIEEEFDKLIVPELRKRIETNFQLWI